MAKTKLEELVVELAVENKELITALKASQSATDKSMKEMSKSIQSLVDDSGKSVSGLQRIMETAVGFIGGQAIIGALDAAASAAAGFFKAVITDGVAAAQVQEDAIQRMNTQLALNGNYSAEASADMQAFASELQKTTKIGDETTLSMIALAGTFGKSNEETKKLIQAAVELSAATGMSLEGAVKNLGKTYAGMTGELGESLPIIRTLTAEQLKSGAALDLIINRFGGSAAAQVKTFSGGVQQLSNSWGDLTEEVGSVITQNQAVLNVIGELNGVVNTGTGEIQDNKAALKELVAEGLIYTIEAAQLLVIALDSVVRAVELVHSGFKMMFNGVGAAVSGLVSLVSDEAKPALDHFLAELESSADDAGEAMSGDSLLGDVAIRLGEMQAAAQRGFDAIKSGAESTIEPTNSAKVAIQQLSEEQKKMAEEGRALAEQLIIAMEEDSEVRSELMSEQFIKEQEMMLAAFEQKKLSEQQYVAAIKALHDKKAADDKTRDEKRLKEELENQQQRLRAASIFFGGFAALAQAGGRETFGIAKRLAQAQAITDGYAAVQRALANPPGFPWNAAIVAGVTAQTLANVSRIEAQQFNTGGTVPGIGFKDTVPAMLTPGEEIIDKSTSKALRGFLGSGAGGSTDAVRVEISISDADRFAEILEAKIVERRREGRSLLGAA